MPVTLELVAGHGQFEFGASRDRAVHVLRFAVSPRLPTGQRIVASPGDLVQGGKVFPGDQIVVRQRLSTNRRMFKARLVLDPTGVKPGKYEGQLAFFAGGAVIRQIPLTATVSSRIRSEFWTLALVFTAILLGATVGGVLKWLTEKGIKLQELRRTFDRVTIHLRDTHMPSDLRKQLRTIEQALDALDVSHAEAGLNLIVPKLDALAELSSFSKARRSDIENQRLAVDQQIAWAARRERKYQTRAGALRSLWERERQRLTELVDASWPDPSKTRSERESFAAWMQVVTNVVLLFDEIREDEQAVRALIELRAGKSEKAEELLRAVEAGGTRSVARMTEADAESGAAEETALAASTAEPRLDETVQAVGSWVRRASNTSRRWLVRNAGFVYGVILALSVALIGMSLLYFPNETFGGPRDWLTLILWGFGVQVTGFTVIQLGGRALGPGPRIAP